MFTGIIETIGIVKDIQQEQENLHLTIESNITNELKIDQSVAHNGICLTVVNIDQNLYTVTAIKETIEKTTIRNWKINDSINLERAMILGSRLDGHIVQGHVDQIGLCKEIKEADLVLSNEPGFYYDYHYGIRHENLIAVRELETTDFGTFYDFETLTVCPFDKNVIVTELL